MEIEYLINNMLNASSRKGKSEKLQQFLMALPLEIDNSGVNNMEEIHDLLRRCEEIIQIKGNGRLKIYIEEDISSEYTRTIVEFIFKGKNTEVTLVNMGQKGRGRTTKQ